MSAQFTFRFWKKSPRAASQRKPQHVPSTVERASGWDRLPPELVDKILGYISDDLPALKACSLTCKTMLDSAHPLIGGWLYLTSTRNRKSYGRSMKSLLKRPKKSPDSFERLVAADRQGLLQHTRHLVVRIGLSPLTPEFLQPSTPYFRSIDKLQTLAIDHLDLRILMPVFNDCFGMFTHSLRGLDIKHVWDTENHLLCFISQFPLLDDLSIRSCYALYLYASSSFSVPQTSPPLRGHLHLSLIMDSQGLCAALARLPGGLKFTSLELKGCGKPTAILTACRSTLRSVSYTWTGTHGKHHSIPTEGSVLTSSSSCRSCPGSQR
jgi:hypothetical protein